MSDSTVLYPLPDELGRIPRDRGAAIEASAGTGKTFLIEHLVVDRLVRGDARLDEMLVVTFTERAAAELRRRIGALILKVRTAQVPAASPNGHAWTIDGAARERLAAAGRALDAASISTIHAFCQRVLTEQAFAGSRLLIQQSVESRTAFAAAFAEGLRQTLAVDPAEAPYLEAYLAAGGSVASLEELLYKARQLRARWASTFEPARLVAAARAFAQLPSGLLDAACAGLHWKTMEKARAELRTLQTAAQAFVEHGQAPRFLAAVDQMTKAKLFSYLEEKLRTATAAAPVLPALTELAEAALPLETVVAQRFGPPIAARLEARKRVAGLYDFDDMLELVRAALGGPRGAELIATLRRRFKLAVVDEFQDTDPTQWEIFRTIFAEGAGRPLYLVGDPKQSIYGFRGADVATYAAARDSVTAPADRHHLRRNFRSTRPVIDAYNAILDQTALAPFFTGEVRYDPPVVYGPSEPAGPEPLAPITLLRVTADQELARLPMRAVRDGLARAVAAEVAALLGGPSPTKPGEIFVLTRTWREAAAAATALAARGVPAVLYNQEGLYASPEARQVRDLLRAVADPRDPGKRLRAWLTAFFGLTLDDLPAAVGAEGDHPLYARLFDWHAAAAREPLGRLCARILEESGVVRRELFLGESTRRLVNIRHLFEVLATEDARTARPLSDVTRRLSALCDGLLVPAPEEGNVQRLEGDRDAVQVMTMHKSKGLEAEVVFLYGGYSPSPNRGVRQYTEGGVRVAVAGRPRLERTIKMVADERASEDQRLFYVALTRARRRLYLPFSPDPEENPPWDGGKGQEAELWKLTGGYAHVNRRLRALRADETQHRHFETRDVPIDPRATSEGTRPRVTMRYWSWRPEAETAAPPALDFARLREERRGPTLTSYSRIKHAEGGYRPPTEIHDETIDAPPLADDELPGGARAGIFVHDLLERVPLETLRESAGVEAWRARADVRELLEATLRRHGRDPHQLAAAARMAHAALTARLPVVGGELAGLAQAKREAREVEFLFPFPDAAGGAERGYVKGFVDLLFEHQGRAYFGDWKTDRLPSWDPASVEAHVAKNYALQEQLYALALVRMLGIADAADYQARFGGTLYIFVRGLPAPGAVRSRRPTFDDIRAWEAEIAERLVHDETDDDGTKEGAA
ncbi:MAG TPA: UvrD-helicase domain-containing protein [Polyangia bacterium]|nr:UvrD-helicase domain-containing protein [Polyangia bacterium]